VTVVTFSEDLYDGFAIDEAAKAYGGVAKFSLERADGLYRVSLEAIPGDAERATRFDESKIALEFQNYALGATIDRLRTSREAGAGGR